MVFTASYAASRLGIDIDVLEELAEQIRLEDGYVSVIDSFAETADSGTASQGTGSTTSKSCSTSDARTL